MADQHDQPDEQAAKKPAPRPVTAKRPAPKKAPAKKAPAKKAPAQKGQAQKAPAKAAPPQAALEAPAEVPALEPAPPHAALTAGPNPAREAAASAKETVRQAGAAPSAPAGGDFGLRLPLTIGLAAVSFIALLLRRLRRG
ncbi:MAG TPA: hypothetical protein PLH92_05185 [Mycobacterium sp.]|uniref:hypothetical protein n=1 Tax=Mycolicibacterium sp. TaxID=2320850 RepID=UPI0025FC778E|nr:hypothetical protein [Mycolicibacterium sp.]HPX35798.1 hypothetical protein [Mycobacterium sp.]HQC76098.1 hypothetical protein [Mycobacterium sp.]